MADKVLIDGKEIEENCLSSVVTRRENAVDDCLLVANNEKGMAYLAAMKLQSEVVIKYYWDDKTGDSPFEVFRGRVIEVNPSTTIAGELMSVKAYGKAICLKDTRVASEFGTESKNGIESETIDAFYTVNGYNFESDTGSSFVKVDPSPWLQLGDSDKIYAPCYKAGGSSVEMGYSVLGTVGSLAIANTIQGDLCTSNANGGIAQSITVGLKTAGTGNIWNGFIKCAIYLHSTLAFVGETEEHSKTLTETPTWFTFNFAGTKPTILPSTVYVIVVWSQSGTGGSPMVVFDNGSTNECHTQSLTYDGFPNPYNPSAHNNYKLSIYCTVAIPEPNWADEYSWTFPDLSTAYEFFTASELYLLVRGKLYDGSGGHCSQITVEADLWINGFWVKIGDYAFTSTSWTEISVDMHSRITTVAQFNSLKLRLKVNQIAGGGIDKGGIDISYVTLDLKGIIYNTRATLRDILCDPSIGIIPNWVEKFHWTENTIPISSGYSVNTDNVYDDPLLMKFLYFPFMSAFDALKDIINILSALRYPNAGPHWIMSPSGQLLIAPIGLHQENGIPEDLWRNYARITPLVVTKHNILENFIQEEPTSNAVLVAGKFIFPQNEIWTEGHQELWRIISGYLIDDYTVHIEGSKSSLRAQGYPVSAPLWTTILKEGLNINVETIGTKKNIPSIEFFGKYQGDAMNSARLIVGTGTFVDNDSYDDYYYIDIISELGTSSWSQIISKKLGAWLGSDTWGKVGAPDWNHINYIGFRIHKTETFLGGSAWLWVDKFSINGSIIRCAYNSTSIATYGVKLKVIKDSLDSTDSLDATDESSMLALVARSELIRNQHPLLHGRIMIELDPRILPGQLIHCHIGRTTSPSVFQIDQDFRIVEVQHTFSIAGAMTSLTLVDDLLNSISIGPTDAYNSVIQCVNPDGQTKDMASLKFTSELDPDLTILSTDYA